MQINGLGTQPRGVPVRSWSGADSPDQSTVPYEGGSEVIADVKELIIPAIDADDNPDQSTVPYEGGPEVMADTQELMAPANDVATELGDGLRDWSTTNRPVI